LSGFSLALVADVLSYAFDLKNIAVLLFDFIAKLFELIPSPLKLMIPMSHLVFLHIEMNVELFIGSTQETKLRSYESKNILNHHINCLLLKMFNNFKKANQLDLKLFE